MATPILAPIPNPLSTHFDSYDLNTLLVIGHQLDALENAISNAAKAEQTESLKSLQTFALMVRFNFSDFREELENRIGNKA